MSTFFRSSRRYRVVMSFVSQKSVDVDATSPEHARDKAANAYYNALLAYEGQLLAHPPGPILQFGHDLVGEQHFEMEVEPLDDKGCPSGPSVFFNRRLRK